MCGIAGYITKDGKKPACTKKQIQAMHTRCESRGRDASGIYWSDKKSDVVFKMPLPASQIKAPWDKILKSTVCLLHTRHATQGSPGDNNNNHPLFDEPVVMVHNGIISNSRDFVSNNITDSYSLLEAYFQVVNEETTFAMNIKKAVSLLTGSFACAFYNIEEKRLVLVKHKNPLCLGFKKNTIFFASTPHILQAVKPEYIVMMREDTMLSIKDNQIKGYNIKARKEISYYGEYTSYENITSDKWEQISIQYGD